MRNTIYDINALFRLLKQYYVDHCPHVEEATAIDIVNYYLKLQGSSAKIVGARAFTSEFKNPNPKKNKGSDSTWNTAIKLEEYLAGHTNRNNLIEDVIALRGWLINENYLREMEKGIIATKELLITHTLTKI